MAAALLYSVANAQERFKLNPTKCEAGKNVEVTYVPLPAMEKDRGIKGIAYSFSSNGKWVADDVKLEKKGGAWSGIYRIPKETGLVAFKFVGDSLSDNNDGQSFCTMVLKENGRPWSGGYAAWGLLRSSKYGRNIPGYIDFSRIPEVSDSIVYYWANNEVSYNPESAVRYAPLFAESARAAKIAGGEERIANAVAHLEKLSTEESLMQAMKMVQYNDTAKFARLGRVILEKYPKGLMAMKNRYFAKFNTADANSIKSHFKGFMDEYPYTPEREEFLSGYGQSYDNAIISILIMDAMTNDYSGLDTLLDQLSFNGAVNLYYKLIEIPHARNPEGDAALLPAARKIVACIERKANQRPLKFEYLSPSEWREEAEKSINSYMAPTYSEILRATGNWDEALKYARLAQSYWNFKRSTVNENMAEILNHFGQKGELKQLLEQSVFHNQMSDSQTAILRNLYSAEHGGDAGFDNYVERLRNPEDKGNMLKKIEKYRVSGKMPEWKVENAQGGIISSQDMKGKVYVIDFWANWCKPCKASLPGMKQAADKFKGDNGVEFIFVDTQEFTPNYKVTAAKYLKDKGLDLTLAFDMKKKGDKTNELLSKAVMSMYKTSGIPMKVVVDANGNVRFLAVGYDGSPSALCDEMVMMVEEAKKPLN